MKNLFTLSALLVAGGYAAAELATFAGLSLPAALNAQNALIAFVVTLSVLLLNADYARRTSIVLPHRGVQSSPKAAASRPRHQAHAIRRGAEAARLATPPTRVIAFPQARSVRCEQAA